MERYKINGGFGTSQSLNLSVKNDTIKACSPSLNVGASSGFSTWIIPHSTKEPLNFSIPRVENRSLVGITVDTPEDGWKRAYAKHEEGKAHNYSGKEYELPENYGAVIGTNFNCTITAGSVIDRYGSEKGGGFFAVYGTPLTNRSLPPKTDCRDYHVYVVLKPFDFQAGVTAPYYDGKGGGLQFRSPELTVEGLIKEGVIAEVKGRYLNKNVKFKCGSGNAVWFRPQNGALKVKINGSQALLDDCRLSLIGPPRPGQCNLQPNPATGTPPGLCTAVIVCGLWSNNVRLKNGGRGVLSSGCSIFCPVGGKITPFSPTTLTIRVFAIG